MELKEKQVKLEELKTVEESERSEEQKSEILTLEKEVTEEIETETKTQERFKELSEKDENSLTSEEVDELIQLEEKYPDAGKPKDPAEDAAKKYAGKYDTVEELLKGINSSEQEKERILKEHPEAIEVLEGKYKSSQRDVTKIVKSTTKPPSKEELSRIPLNNRELHEMTQPEYDKWEKEDKLAAHSWLSNASRKESLRAESRKKVFAKYPQFYAMVQGVVAADDKWQVFDRLADENPEWFKDMNGPERCMEAMEKELKITSPSKPPKKPTILKPGFEQGKGGGGKPTTGALSEEEFAKLSEEDQLAYMEGSVDKKGS